MISGNVPESGISVTPQLPPVNKYPKLSQKHEYVQVCVCVCVCVCVVCA